MMFLWDMQYHDGSKTPDQLYGNFTGMSGRAGPNSDMSVLRSTIVTLTAPDFFMSIPPEKLIIGVPWCA